MLLCDTTCVSLKADKTSFIGKYCSTIVWETVGDAVFGHTLYALHVIKIHESMQGHRSRDLEH